MSTIANTDAARELFIYAENDVDTYRASLTPIMDNMDAKRRRGCFDAAKAVKAFEYAAEYAARRYVKEFGGVWHDVFNAATRRAVAASLLDHYLADVL